MPLSEEVQRVGRKLEEARSDRGLQRPEELLALGAPNQLLRIDWMRVRDRQIGDAWRARQVMDRHRPEDLVE